MTTEGARRPSRLRRPRILVVAGLAVLVAIGSWVLVSHRQAREAARPVSTVEAAEIAGAGRTVVGSWTAVDLADARGLVDQWASRGVLTPRSTEQLTAESPPDMTIEQYFDHPDGTLLLYVVGSNVRKNHDCGADYRAAALETDSAVAVLVTEDRGTWPGGIVNCASVGQIRAATVQLRRPLGDRQVLDVAVGRVTERAHAQIRLAFLG